MKILHVEDYFDPSAGYQINELLYASKDFEDEVFLITSKDMSPFHKKVDVSLDKVFEIKTGIKIYRLDVIVKLSGRLILKDLKKNIEEINPDVVFMHGIGDFKDFQLYMSIPNYRIIRDCHMSWVASKNKLRHLYYLLYRLFFSTIINRTDKYDVIYALGDEEYEYLRRIGINDKKINFLRHGYNDSIIYYDDSERKAIREQYKFVEDDIVIAYIGKFNYSKRPDLIIDIIDRFDIEFTNKNKLKLFLIGPKDEKYMKEFNKKLEVIQCKIKIIMEDSMPFSQLRKYYSASDICIFPKETTLSSIHAQVCGCSVIMENCKSNMERVVNKSNLYEINNLNEASQILKRIIDNKEYIKRIDYKDDFKDREYKIQVRKFKESIKK